MVISFFLAVTLWGVVRVQELQPNTQSTVVAIKGSNLDPKFVITKMDENVSVDAAGPSDSLKNLSLAHLVAVVDLRDAVVGKHSYPARIIAPDSALLDLLTKTKLMVPVAIELKRQKTFTVSVEPRGSLGDRNLQFDTATPYPAQIIYSGPESKVRSIKKVRVTPDLASADPDNPEDMLPETPVALDSQDRPVLDVDPIPPLVNVHVHFIVANVVRPVVVNPRFTGQVPAGYSFETYSISPTNVNIAGPSQQVAAIATVETEQIDLSQFTSTQTLSVGLHVPPGVTLTTRTPVKITVVIKPTSIPSRNAPANGKPDFPDHVPPLEPAKKGGN
jgi:YbbR domain-containing protein